MKKIGSILIFVLIIGGLIAAYASSKIFGTATLHEKAKLIYISEGSTYDEVAHTLDTASIVSDLTSLGWVANLMKYPDRIKSGRYSIPPGLSNRELISLLRSGAQEPVDLTISHARTIMDVAGSIGKQMNADSAEIVNAFLEPSFLESIDMNASSVISLIIPNTYEMYWNASATKIAERLESEYKKYWDKREDDLASIGMTKLEVATLASIVESESQMKSERPTIAGVYQNRLKRNIPLQADPTVVFAVGDFTIRRVLNKHLAYDSPYNTYMYPGLPPGPICMPSISSIEAVLYPDTHDYLFFCAKPGYNAGHNFAKSNSEHERNARVYRRWLNAEGIKG